MADRVGVTKRSGFIQALLASLKAPGPCQDWGFGAVSVAIFNLNWKREGMALDQVVLDIETVFTEMGWLIHLKLLNGWGKQNYCLIL
jgi:hypothetical protein